MAKKRRATVLTVMPMKPMTAASSEVLRLTVSANRT
jgi:hypothetical protein